jgi:hypothetical protein
MPSTYTLISSNVLSSSAASVTFSAIPATYTDLVLRMSIRASASAGTRQLQLVFNSDSSALYSVTQLEGDGATAYSQRGSANTSTTLATFNANTSTANTFSNFEIYIPSYTASQSKPMSFDTALEDNATTAYRSVSAQLYRSNTAISTILIRPSSTDFMATSSFYLYGIKNS